MSEALIFGAGSVLFVLTTAATFLFLMLRFNEVYENADSELATLESAAVPTDEMPPGGSLAPEPPVATQPSPS
jgi:hypothetical protein